MGRILAFVLALSTTNALGDRDFPWLRYPVVRPGHVCFDFMTLLGDHDFWREFSRSPAILDYGDGSRTHVFFGRDGLVTNVDIMPREGRLQVTVVTLSASEILGLPTRLEIETEPDEDGITRLVRLHRKQRRLALKAKWAEMRAERKRQQQEIVERQDITLDFTNLYSEAVEALSSAERELQAYARSEDPIAADAIYAYAVIQGTDWRRDLKQGILALDLNYDDVLFDVNSQADRTNLESENSEEWKVVARYSSVASAAETLRTNGFEVLAGTVANQVLAEAESFLLNRQ